MTPRCFFSKNVHINFCCINRNSSIPIPHEMTLISPSSSLAAIGRVSSHKQPLRSSRVCNILASSHCSISIALRSNTRRYVSPLHQHVRFASSGTSAKPAVASPPENAKSTESDKTNGNSISIPNLPFPSPINPPSTTLPAPLDLPTRKPDQGKLSHLFQTGKAYWRFYKTGVLNVYHNARHRRLLIRQARALTTPKSPPEKPVTIGTAPDSRILGEYDAFPLTRAQFQFFGRSWRDAKRIPVFVVLLGIFGEYLPLVVIFCTPLVPYPCRIPRQIEKERRKSEERRARSFRGELDGSGGVPVPLGKESNRLVRDVGELDGVQLRHVARSLGLYFKMWDRFDGVWPPTGTLRRRVEKRLDYLALDDALFRRDGGVELLEGEEVKIAAEERGIDILGREEAELIDLLKIWQRGAKDGKSLGMLLARPRVWMERIVR